MVAFYTSGVPPLSAVQTADPVRVVSVSLGSSSRDHVAEAELLGRRFLLERRGTDGDWQRARELIRELDGQVGAIGLGGIDLYVVAGGRRYRLRDAAKLAAAAKTTPVVDGSGLKDTLERDTVRYLHRQVLDLQGKRVLLVSAVDRFGMAEELVRVGARCTFGDLLFILGLPIPLRRLSTLRRLGALILPVATQLPFKMLYPTGKSQETVVASPRHTRFFAAAEIIAGDFLLIRRYLPPQLPGRTLLTNTVTAADIELLRRAGVSRLVTTTPEFSGRSFGTNVMEAVFAALGARTLADYQSLLRQLNWQPRVLSLEPPALEPPAAG